MRAQADVHAPAAKVRASSGGVLGRFVSTAQRPFTVTGDLRSRSVADLTVTDTLGTWPQSEGSLASGTDYLTDSSLIVDRSDDADVRACTSAANDCTLRGAINLLNDGHMTGTTITFAPTITKVSLSSSLPIIGPGASHNAIAGSNGVPRIDGAALTTGNIFTLNASEFSLTGLSIVNGPASDVDVYVVGGSHNVIANNYLGTLPPSSSITNCTPSLASGAITRTAGVGVVVASGVVGSSATGDGALYITHNTIGCHPETGVYLYGSDYVRIGEDVNGLAAGNYIGVNASGVAISNTFEGVAIAALGTDGAQGNIVRGNVIKNNRPGVWLYGTGTNNSSSTTLNHIVGNQIANNMEAGVLLKEGAYLNAIGGDQDADRNLIYGNSQDGIALYNSSSNGILGNYIGSVAGGNPNGRNGILIDGGDSNLIGSMYAQPVALERGNVLSGNWGDGVQLINGAAGTLLTRNFIGTNISGTAAVPNRLSGVSLMIGAHHNTLGANLKRNLIAGNGGAGVYISDITTTNNLLDYNDIGLNSTPPAGLSAAVIDRAAASGGGGSWLAIPNGGGGVNLLGGTHHNVITDSTFLAANQGSGLYIADGSHDNVFYNVAVFSNTLYGVILDGSGTSNNTFTASSFTQNGYDGIGERNGATDNRWSRIMTAQNGGLCIDKNVTSDFSNTLTLPVPTITSVLRAGGVITVSGTASSTVSNLGNSNTSKVEVYTVWPNASGFGEGLNYLGVTTADSAGHWQIAVPIVPGGCYTAFETNTGGSGHDSWNYSSEFGSNSCRTFLSAIMK